MNYQRIYDQLIARGVSRTPVPGAYYETHHILPKCLGGSDERSNLVKLTAEEHYLAHQLLIKLHPGHHGIVFAAYLMTKHTGTGRMNNKLFGWIRKKLAENRTKKGPMPQYVKDKLSLAKKGRKWDENRRAIQMAYLSKKVMSDQERENRRQAALGRLHKEETKVKIGMANTGKKRSEEHCQRQSEFWKGKDISRIHTPEARERARAALKGLPKSEEHKRKLAEANRGKKASEDSRRKMSESRRGVPKTEVHNIAVAQSKTGTKKVEISPGVFKMLNPDQLKYYQDTGEYVTLKDWRKLNA